MNQPKVAESVAVAASAAQMTTNIRAHVLAVLRRLFGLGPWHSADAERFVTQVLPIIVGTSRQVGQITAVALARQIEDLGGTADLSNFDPSGYRRNADPAQVYIRPYREVWDALAQGQDLSTAVDRGQVRLEQIAATDLQLAKTHAAHHVLSQAGGVVGYRRTLNLPSCALCVVASTQRYYKADLLPIHPACDCGVEPIVGHEDPGQVFDEELLAQAHQAVQNRLGVSDPGARDPDYRKLMLVRQHGEMGPVLTVASQKFEGPRA